MSTTLKTVSQFLWGLFWKEPTTASSRALVTMPSSSENNDELFEYVKRKMSAMENEAIQVRLKSQETIMRHMLFEMRKNNAENQLLREMVLLMSTNVEELLNASTAGNTLSENSQQQLQEDHAAYQHDPEEHAASMDYEDEELHATWDLHGRKANKKLRIN